MSALPYKEKYYDPLPSVNYLDNTRLSGTIKEKANHDYEIIRLFLAQLKPYGLS